MSQLHPTAVSKNQGQLDDAAKAFLGVTVAGALGAGGANLYKSYRRKKNSVNVANPIELKKIKLVDQPNANGVYFIYLTRTMVDSPMFPMSEDKKSVVVFERAPHQGETAKEAANFLATKVLGTKTNVTKGLFSYFYTIIELPDKSIFVVYHSKLYFRLRIRLPPVVKQNIPKFEDVDSFNFKGMGIQTYRLFPTIFDS